MITVRTYSFLECQMTTQCSMLTRCRDIGSEQISMAEPSQLKMKSCPRKTGLD